MNDVQYDGVSSAQLRDVQQKIRCYIFVDSSGIVDQLCDSEILVKSLNDGTKARIGTLSNRSAGIQEL